MRAWITLDGTTRVGRKSWPKVIRLTCTWRGQLGPAYLGGVLMVDTCLGGAGQLGLARRLAIDVAQWLGHLASFLGLCLTDFCL